MEHHEDHTGTPLLRQLRHTDPFVVPVGFFEHFPHTVQAVLPHTRPSWRVRSWQRPSIALALVAIVVIAGIWVASPTEPLELTTVRSIALTDRLLEDHWDDLVYQADPVKTGPTIGDLTSDEALTWLEQDPQQLDELLHLN